MADVDNDSALAFIRAQFEQTFGTGFGAAAETAYQTFLRTGSFDLALAEFRASAEYKARFPALDALRQKGRPITEAAYLDLERQYTQIARQFDLPTGFYDTPDDFTRLIGGEVSPAEWQRRLTAWQTYERDTRDPVAHEEHARQLEALGYPASDGTFLAIVLDPKRAVATLERALAAGQIGTEARRAGYGQIDTGTGLELADLGVTAEQARQGFGALADSRELFGGLPGEAGAETFGQSQQIGAAFGTDQASRRRLETRARRRRAEFEGSSSAGLGRAGVVGLGSTA